MNKYVKYTLIVLGAAGLIYGGYRLYKHLNNNGFEFKFGRKINIVNVNPE
jgi:hypothetical protein